MQEEKANIAVIKQLDGLMPMDIVHDDRVGKMFIEKFTLIHGVNGKSFYENEKFYFDKMLQENPILQECTKLSIYGCFMNVAVNGLTLDPSRPLCYFTPANIKVKGSDGVEHWEKRLTIRITGPGELVMRMRANQIQHADNPVIVYDGDIFGVELDENGNKKVTYKATIPRKSNKIIGVFIKIIHNGGMVDYQWLLENDIDRLRAYSEKANSYFKDGQRVIGKANALYTSQNGGIDSGFLESKMIKHAFDAYPKVRTGNFTQLESHIAPEIDYGIEETTQETVETTAQDVTNQELENGAFGSNSEPENNGSFTVPETEGGAF